MYTIYWTTHMGQFHITIPETEVKSLMDSLDRLGMQIDKVEMT
jgi:hypothetical protein